MEEITCDDTESFLKTIVTKYKDLSTRDSTILESRDVPQKLRIGVLIYNKFEEIHVTIPIKLVRSKGVDSPMENIFRKALMSSEGKEAFYTELVKAALGDTTSKIAVDTESGVCVPSTVCITEA